MVEVEGYTIVKREGRAPRVHLLRPYEQCNVDDAEEKVKVEGGRGEVLRELSRMGYRRATSCKWCFPQSEQPVYEENTSERVEDDPE